MCIMAAHKSNVDIPSDETLNRCWTRNPDGGGFAYLKSDKIYIYRTLDKNKFIEKFKKHRGDNMNAPFIWHMRAASHGVVSLQNTHPFTVNAGLVFAHNGHISKCDTSRESPISDTNKFNQTILKNLPDELITSDAFDWLIRPFIAHSKLLFLSKSSDITIVGKEKGTEADGIWYSNDMFKPANKPVVTYYHDRSWESRASSETIERCCPFCNEKRSYMENILYNYEGYVYAFKLCWTCMNKLFKKYDFTQACNPNTSTISYKCTSCNGNTGVHGITMIDAVSGLFKKHCGHCFVDNWIGTEKIQAIENVQDNLELLEILDVFHGDETNKENVA